MPHLHGDDKAKAKIWVKQFNTNEGIRRAEEKIDHWKSLPDNKRDEYAAHMWDLGAKFEGENTDLGGGKYDTVEDTKYDAEPTKTKEEPNPTTGSQSQNYTHTAAPREEDDDESNPFAGSQSQDYTHTAAPREDPYSQAPPSLRGELQHQRASSRNWSQVSKYYTYGSTYSRNGPNVPYMQYKMFTFIKLQ